MNQKNQDKLASAPSEEELAKLFSALGARDEVPRDILDEMEGPTRLAWQRQVFQVRRKRRQRIVQVGLLAAAAVLLVFFASGGIARLLESPADAEIVVASVERTVGSVRLAATGNPLSATDELKQGAVVDVPDAAGAVLRLSNRAEVRLSPSSRLRIGTGGELELESGKVYVRTHGEAPNQVSVITAWGIATDIGTRFMVEVNPSTTVVQVREGKVEVAVSETGRESGGTETAEAGERLTVDEGGRFSRTETGLHDASWSWISALAQPFVLENSTLDQYLTWLASETGYEIRFENEATEAALLGVQLHGSIAGLAPTETIDDALLSVGLEASLNDGVLTIVDGD